MAQEMPADHLGDEWKGYVVRITGGNDKQGFPMKQGVGTTGRVFFFFLRARAATAHAELENASVSPSVDALSTITFPSQLDCRQEGRRRDSRSYRHPDPSPIGTQESIQHPEALLFGQIRPCYPVRCSTHHLQGW